MCYIYWCLTSGVCSVPGLCCYWDKPERTSSTSSLWCAVAPAVRGRSTGWPVQRSQHQPAANSDIDVSIVYTIFCEALNRGLLLTTTY